MKKHATLLVLFITSLSFAQNIPEKKIETQVSEVTVFIENAQVTRKTKQFISKGKRHLKFINLSPFIDAKSIQLKVDGKVNVLSVNHQQNYIDKLKKDRDVADLETKLEQVYESLQIEQTYLTILKEELAFLQENRDIGGKNQSINITTLRDASDFYSKKLTELKLKEIEHNKRIEKLNEERSDLNKQLASISSVKLYPNGEILVRVEATENSTASFELSYMVSNAGWFPSYDIRAKNINEPVELVYKANVKQDTKVDWSNVKLRLSSAEPNVSGVIPNLKTYFLNYHQLPPSYKNNINEVTGFVFDTDGEPLPGVNIVVKGTTIGTSTDFDGKYSISVPDKHSHLVFSFVGFNSQTVAADRHNLNIHLTEDAQLEEVVVTAYGTSKSNRHSAAVGSASTIKIRGMSSFARGKSKTRAPMNSVLPTLKIENQTSVEFEILDPYSIKSDNKSYSVNVASYELPASYQYYSIPKIDQAAFLTAKIIDWEKYNLLEGEANIFFEDTYVGKSLLDVRYASDTLQISLGRDKNVSVNRMKVKEHITKRFIGSKKEETREWKIIVKNNKGAPINMVIYDQVPVATLDEIKVEVEPSAGAKMDPSSGEIKWEFRLSPKLDKTCSLRYRVKYPKYRNLSIQ